MYVDPSQPIVPSRPILRGRLHQVAVFAAAVGLIPLVEQASTPRAKAVAWVYGLASVLLYLTSSSYHVFAKSPRARYIMQRADHSMIFVLIAGTFTPIGILAVPDPYRWPAMATMWIGALGGIALKVFALDRLPRLGGAMYIVLGWAGIVIFPALWHRPFTLAMVAVGGVLYTVGAVLFAMNKPRLSPRWFGYHEVWHCFGVIAGVCLYAANLGLVRAG